MRGQIHLSLIAAALLIGGLTTPVLVRSQPSTATTESAAVPIYKVDPVHSSILFRVKHLDATYFYGRFNDVSGNVVFDEKDPSKTSIDIEVKAESVDTHEPKRDQHLKSPDFFNAKEFPTIAFKSEEVKKTGDNTYEAKGTLRLHGVAKPVQFEFTHTGTGKGMRGEERIGGEATLSIKRSDFGMTFMPNAVGDEVKLIISLECVKQ